MRTTPGFCLYIFALLMEFMGLKGKIEAFEAFCISYTVYVLGLSITVYLAFKNGAFRDWCFRELGEERVRRVVGNPVIGKVAAMATTIGGSVTVVTALAFSHVDATLRDMRIHEFKIESI